MDHSENQPEEFNNQKRLAKLSKPGARTGIVTTAAYLIDKVLDSKNEDKEESIKASLDNMDASVEVLKTYSGENEGVLEVGKSLYAGANLAEIKAGNEDIGLKTQVLSASAHCEYGLNNSIGVDASLVRAEGHIGPVKVGTGINFDCHASIGVNGIEASLLGTGFSIGPKIAVKTPIADLSVKLI